MGTKTKTWQGPDRRKRKVTEDPLFKLMIVGNIVAWLSFLVSLFIFHYARPETDIGLYRYLGVSTRSYWLAPLTNWLALLLSMTLLFASVTFWLHKKRARRAYDHLGLNLFILMICAVCGLVWVLVQLI